jgi:hypothetical protein
MNKLENRFMNNLLKSERLSEKQISKIQKELDFFKEKDYKVIDIHSTYTIGGGYYYSYLLEKGKFFHRVECGYDVSVFGKVKRTYNLVHCIDDFIITDDTKKFKDFIKRYF